MTHALSRSGAVLLGAALLALPLLATPARAQIGVTGVGSNGILNGPVVEPRQNGPRRTIRPPALPGSRTIETDAAPFDRPPSDMHPNEALFDAVNRGDVASVRDAVSRGADLNARNILGLTALEQSVDLGRNDITFLLLSLRGASGGGGAAPQGSKATPVQTAAAPKPEPPRPAPRPAPVTARAAPVAVVQQYADTPGTPVPQAGFLGFGPVMR